MAITVSEYDVLIVRKDAIKPDLTSEDVKEALKGALITKLGWSRVHETLDSGDLRIEVTD